MRDYYLIACLLFGSVVATLAQPSNNTCTNPIQIPPSTSWCSGVGEFSNQGATPSGYSAATCFSNAGADVWFTFVPVATDITITVIGNIPQGSGGTLQTPEVVLYSGVCGGTFFQERCDAAIGNNNVVELYKGGLIIGQIYYIRVQGRNNRTGTFQLCINNYNPPAEPGADCFTASVLCDKNTFVVQQVTGPGQDPREANDAPCLNIFPGNVETNSTWFTWTAANDGSLTFVLHPLNPSDDLDFVVYELPEGPLNCRNKRVLRCMASGDNRFPSRCMGPTGLREGSTDTSEPPGCNDPRQDNFLAPLQMRAGVTYALFVNNFSATGNGFRIEFGGSGDFQGPDADFTVSEPDLTACVGQPFTFTDASTINPGTIDAWEWRFGPTASQPTVNTRGAHTITFNRPGTKPVVLTVTSNRGCKVTTVKTVNVECCPDHFTDSGIANNTTCRDAQDGSISLNVRSNYAPYTYAWSNGAATDNVTGLAPGSYTVTVTDQATCNTVLTFDITQPPPFTFDTLITRPTCGGGRDGAVTLTINGGTAPYQFNWNNAGFTSDNTLRDIPRGLYNLVLRDANNCEEELSFAVREFDFMLSPAVQAVTPPNCHDSNDGFITVALSTGLPPFQYNWNDGRGYLSENSLRNLAPGAYQVTVRDANLCEGDFTFSMNAPPPLVLNFDIIDASCNGLSDGRATATVSGGVGNYTYLWNTNAITSSITQVRSGNYSLRVRDGNGCEINGNIRISEPEAILVRVTDILNVVCNGDRSGAITVMGMGGTQPYEYSADGNIFQSGNVLTGLGAGTYTITLEDAQGCIATTTAVITEPIALIVDAGPDQRIDLGYSTGLQAISNDLDALYEWSPADGLSCNNCPNPTAGPVRTTSYRVTVTNKDGCTASDEVQIRVALDRPVYIPNAFSPNGDGSNDYFTIFSGPAVRQIIKLRVFDRWGNLVFENSNVQPNQETAGWNGTFNGKPLSQGVYAYMAEVEFIDDKVILFEGDVTIVR